MMDLVIAVGEQPRRTLGAFASHAGRELVWPEGLDWEPGYAVAWFPADERPPFRLGILPPQRDRIRHRRKYAEGDMRYNSFFFRGPGGRHNLRAQNLIIFAQIAEGIDEETWLYHLRRGDYSRWLRTAVKDPYLADQVQRIEQRSQLPADESRTLI